MTIKASPPQWLSSPPFYQHLGLQLESIGQGQSAIRLAFAPHFGNSRGEMHGGVVAALVDASMSQAVRSSIEIGPSVATISLNLNYMALSHGDLLCCAQVIKGGKSLVFVEATVTDESKQSVCHATATYRVLRQRT